MAVFYKLSDLPPFQNAVLTVGTFDGLHQGHQAILQEVTRHARHILGESVLLTFEPHPRKMLFPNETLGIITPLSEKIPLITQLGIDHIVVLPFTRDFASLSAEAYIEHFLVGIFHPHTIIIGYDHRFGHDRQGDIAMLERCSKSFQYEVMEIPAQLIDAAKVSSTRIRNALMEGRITDATQMLGRPYSLKGIVVHGAKLGRTIGFPTANLEPADADQLVPALGVYAVFVFHHGTQHKGMMSIGKNPTVTDLGLRRIEVNLLDFDGDLYGETLEISFIDKIRDEEKFPDLDALTRQLLRDREATLSLLG